MQCQCCNLFLLIILARRCYKVIRSMTLPEPTETDVMSLRKLVAIYVLGDLLYKRLNTYVEVKYHCRKWLQCCVFGSMLRCMVYKTIVMQWFESHTPTSLAARRCHNYVQNCCHMG